MCLIPKFRQVFTAEEDIPVFKVLEVTSSGYYSPIYRMKWEQGETKTVPDFSGKNPHDKLHFGQLRNIRFTDQIPFVVNEIYHGLHSFSSSSFGVYSPHDIFKMTIPKGTKYIVDDNVDIVSLALRFDNVRW
jgi:hypothetical protein